MGSMGRTARRCSEGGLAIENSCCRSHLAQFWLGKHGKLTVGVMA